MKKVICATLLLTLIAGNMQFSNALAVSPPVKTSSVTSSSFSVHSIYYYDEGALYRIQTDGSLPVKINDESISFSYTLVGDYLYFFRRDGGLKELKIQPMRQKLRDPYTKPEKFGDKKIRRLTSSGNLIYFMEEDGKIYKAPADVSNRSEAKPVTDLADPELPMFMVVHDRIYFNTVRDGYSWVASLPADGQGDIQWIAEGALLDPRLHHTYKNNLYMMIYSPQYEDNDEKDSMIMYSLPVSGGTVRAVNSANPLDFDEVSNGTWVGDSFLFNRGVINDDFSSAKALLLQKSGNVVQLSQQGIYNAVQLDEKRIVYWDSKNHAYVAELGNKKIAKTTKLPVENISSLGNTTSNGQLQSAILSASSGIYVLNKNLTLKKISNIKTDYFYQTKDLPGIIHTIENGKNKGVYYLSEDGKTHLKLSDGGESFRMEVID